MPLRVRQGLVIGLGVVAAAVMTWLGLWQLQVFTDAGNASVQARAQQPAVPLLEHVAADGTVGDIYGKPVTVTGRSNVQSPCTTNESAPFSDGATSTRASKSSISL